MENKNTILAVIQQLRNIFLNKSDLRGYDDWDAFFGCINALENVAAALAEEPQEENTAEE